MIIYKTQCEDLITDKVHGKNVERKQIDVIEHVENDVTGGSGKVLHVIKLLGTTMTGGHQARQTPHAANIHLGGRCALSPVPEQTGGPIQANLL